MDTPRTVRELIDRAARLYADNTAYVQTSAAGETETYTFSQFKSDTDALSRALAAQGLTGKHIGVIGLNSYMWIVCYASILRGLGVVVPIPADTPKEELGKLIKRADIECILADDMFAAGLKDVIRTYSFGECARIIEEAAGKSYAEIPAPAPESLAKLLFTSGTTGERRAVMLSQANMMCIAVSEFVAYAGDVSVSILPVSHGFESVCHVLVMLYTGGTLHLCQSLRAFPPMLAASGADSVYIVPALAEALITRFRPFLDKSKKLTKIICGGAPVPQALIDAYDKLGIDVLAGYGLSECSPLVSLNMKKKPGSTGAVGSYCSVKISDEGEILIKGLNVMSGYYKDERATSAAFTPDGWLKTGDLGHLDEDNYLYLTGRIKNLIILPNGENVSPEELESLMRDNIPNVQDALIYEDGAALCALIFLGGDTSEQAEKTTSDALKVLNAKLPPYKRISKFKLTADPIPVSATGKKVRDNK